MDFIRPYNFQYLKELCKHTRRSWQSLKMSKFQHHLVFTSFSEFFTSKVS